MKLKFLFLIGIIWFAACGEKKGNTEKFNEVSEFDSFPAEIRKALINRGYLGNFLEDVKPQQFNWMGNGDTILIGKEGVRVHFFKDCLVHEDGSQVKGEVEIHLKEYVKPGDMILAGMTTSMKDGRILRTGGMIYLTAFSEGKELKVSNVRPIQIDFPIQGEEIKGMRLFTGDRNSRGGVEWSLAQKRPEKLRALPDSGTYQVFDYLPRCLECFTRMRKVLQKQYSDYFPTEAKNYILSIDIEPGGSISYVGFPDSFPLDLVEGVLNSLDTVVPFFAARVNGQEQRYTAMMNLNFAYVQKKIKLNISSSDIEEYSIPLLHNMMHQGIYTFYSRKQKQYENESEVLRNSIFEFDKNFKTYLEELYLYIKEIRKDSVIFDFEALVKMKQKRKYYSQLSFNMKLLNSDVFANYPSSALKLFEINNIPENCVGVIYFPKTKSIINGNPISLKGLSFGRIPYAQPFRLICFGPLNDQVPKEETEWYYAQIQINPTNWDSPKLDFKVVSYEKLTSSIKGMK